MNSDDLIHLGADGAVEELPHKYPWLPKFWSGLKIFCVFLALLLSLSSLILSSRVSRVLNMTEQDFQADFDDAEAFYEHQSSLIVAINRTLRKTFEKYGDDLTPVPTMFDCYRVYRLSRASTVTYHGCFIDTTNGAMDINTGIFTVRDPGIYVISFTAKYVSSSKGRFGAWSDIFVNETVIGDSQREYNGNSGSKTESSTHTILVMYPLQVGHQLRVQFNKDGSSYIHSDNDHDVHFTARKVSKMPTNLNSSTTGPTSITNYEQQFN